MHESSDITRFWSKVQKGTGCWEWRGGRYQPTRDYGSIKIGGRSGRKVLTHRFSWEVAFGPIPDGMYVCHRCDNERCVRPAHLFLGRPIDNVRDMDRKGRANRAPAWSVSPHRVKAHARLSEADVREIRRLAAEGANIMFLSRIFEVSRPSIRDLLSGSSWSWLE
jgi:hypothetical protein